MDYCLFKLCFDTAVHFGTADSALSLYTSEMTFCADTLFSALCHTADALGGRESAARLCAQAQAGELLLSDGMPWQGERLFLPKPCAHAGQRQEAAGEQRKAMKKLAWIALEDFGKFAASLHGGESFDAKSGRVEFGCAVEYAKANVRSRESAKDGETLPYQVGAFRFAPGCGLWLLVGCKTEAQLAALQTLLEALGISGIGGKVTAGYGKFHLEDTVELEYPFDETTQWLHDALHNENAAAQLLLSTALPADGELQGLLPKALFQMKRRAGFVQAAGAVEDGKKQVQYFLAAGSVLPQRFAPRLYTVGTAAGHPVYRFSGPVMLGVKL